LSIYDDVKKALQDFLAPELKEIKGELTAINIRISAIDQRFDDLIERLDLKKRIEKLEQERDEKRAS